MKTYTPTLHAIDRAKHRLGIEVSDAARWFNSAMQQARYVGSQTMKGALQGIYEYGNHRIIVNMSDKTIITIKPTVDTSIIRSIIDKEFRKLSREVTRNTRLLEKEIAELTVQMGERMVAKANAKNPNTRAIIQRDIDEVVATIGDKKAEITQEIDRLDNFKHAAGAII